MIIQYDKLFLWSIFGLLAILPASIRCDERCLNGTLHDGTPTGVLSTLAEVQVYRATPNHQHERKKAILVFPDIFGIGLKNTQLVADRLANQTGLTTYLIDTFDGDQVPAGDTPGQPRPGFNLTDWLSNHDPTSVLPIIQAVISNLTQGGVERFAGVGYCFGGKYVFLSSERNWIQVGSTSHPSLLQVPKDLIELRRTSKVPLLINSAELDQQFTLDYQRQADEILGDGKYKPGYKRTYFLGASHGFGLRADLNNSADRTAYFEPTNEIVRWLDDHL